MLSFLVRGLRVGAAFAAAAFMQPALASDFSVTPIRAELKPGALTETITVTNHGPDRLRVSMKLMDWSQDAEGKDVYRDTGDLVYFPRQMEVAPMSKRLVRVGVKAPAGVVERTYRLFIEEEPELGPKTGSAQIAVHFKFGVPIFVTPAAAKPVPEIMDPVLQHGKLSLLVKNTGNQHFRLVGLSVRSDTGYTQAIQGWYSLAGTQRIYSAEIPPEVCRKAQVLTVEVQGEGVKFDRKVNVDPADCS